MAIAIYPGSFDPVTLGHLSVIRRAKGFSEKLIVLVSHNPSKKTLFSSQERISLIEQSLNELGLSGIEVRALDNGLLAEQAKSLGAQIIIKGLRTAADLDYELQFASMNRDLTKVETVFLPTEPQYSQISSSLIREVAVLGGDVSNHVTKAVSKALAEKVGK
ncbi:MAG: pantetheine-phosphate adenylyltransferase [Actinobacteria bacterium]|uniref:Phosphopantetheine adenylyltransferase n=1 Tax=freshwater metagenome TaxID=449393 RepID=A0A6J6BSJ0_9ZZZZ|nr:pantetheine-phosphate adenylyltransferase [Actinomycetota bacterium]MTA89581.1 pantetheine-phosphate adenylyltransferase [Actinomycetota bacterium]